MLTEQSDKEIYMLIFLSAVANKKDCTKLEELYINHKYLMLHTSFEILKDYQLAEDAVHKAFLRLINNLYKIADISCNKTRNFLVIIVRNISINMYNERKKQFESGYDGLEQELGSMDALTEDFVISKETVNEVLKCISELDNKYRDILMLKYSYDYDISEISQLLGLSSENTRVRLHRGRKMLIQKLSEVNINE